MRLALSFSALLFTAAGAAAQDVMNVPPTRGDAHFAIGWQNLREKQADESTPYRNDWLNSIFFAGAGGGWYWTEHLKTQVEFGGGTSGRQYRFSQQIAGGATTYSQSELRLRETNVDVVQQYQFFHNQWFHPHVGLGVDVARRHSSEHYYPITVFDNVTRTTRSLSPEHTEVENEWLVKPIADLGFKAYMTRRSFFTTDAKLRCKSGIDEFRLRLGFGIDF